MVYWECEAATTLEKIKSLSVFIDIDVIAKVWCIKCMALF